MEPLALPIRARFVPLCGHPPARLTGVCHASRATGFFAVLLALGSRLVLFVPAAGAGSRISADFHGESGPVLSVVPVAEGAAAPPWHGDRFGQAGLAENR